MHMPLSISRHQRKLQSISHPAVYLAAAIGILLASVWAIPLPVRAEGLSILDVARIRAVRAAEISPDGAHVAYLLSVPLDPQSGENGPARSELHVSDRQGNSRPYVTGDSRVSSIGWTPDGSAISFLAKLDGDEQTAFYRMPVDGGGPEKIAELETGISDYAWRTDGKQAIVMAREPKSAEQKELESQGFNADIYEEQLRFTELWKVDGDPQTDEDPQLLAIQGEPTEVHYSPDGDKLVMALAEKPLIDDYYMYRRLHVIDPESAAVLAKIKNPGKLGPVRWSPDGRTIAFCSGEDINDPSAGRLMVASSDGGTPRQVMPEYLPNITDIEWQDKNSLLFTTEDGCLAGYGSVEVASGQRQMFLPPRTPVISEFSVSDDREHAAFIASSPQHPAEAFFYDHQAKPARLTVSNPWLGDRQLAPQEVISYPAKQDGVRIEGVLIRPLDQQEDERHPLLVAVHGGPEASIPHAWVSRYVYPGQVAAAKGYAVFYPNYRGSTGRGVNFAKAHQADYGGQEFDDIIDGVDYLIDSGLVDQEKVGITGGSYGGFATAWCSTKHSERFAAGVTFVGISDQISKAGTTDIPDEMYHVHARKRLWEDWDFFLERSPIYYVEKCRTPLLILHGRDDTRVNPGQSLELYRSLKILGQTPVRLIFYPGEGHGNRNAAARYDYNLRMMRWMDHYLLGDGGTPPDPNLDYGLDQEEEEEADNESQ